MSPSPIQVITNNDAIVCDGTGIDIDYTTPTVAGDITLTAVYPAGVTGSIIYTGQSVGVAGNISETLSNTNFTSQTVTYTFTASAAGCTDAVTSVDVVVDPTPTITNLPSPATICSGDQLNFTAAGDVAGTVFTWTCAICAYITGNSDGVGSLTDI